MSTFTPTVESIGDAAITNSILDRSITELKDNNITKIGASAFNSCSALTAVVFGNVTEVGSDAFCNCPSLSVVDFNASVYLPSGIFRGCHKLETLVLRGAMNGAVIGTFMNSAIGNGMGYIYVPAAQMDSYKAHAHWSNFADQFRKLEEWTIDGTVTGALIEDASNKHMVRFYNSDGTLLSYTIVADGSDAVYSGADPVDPAGSGDQFGGFEPAPTNVTADMDVYAKFLNAWDEVSAAIADGTYTTKYAIGDTVPLDLGSEGVLNMQIVAFDMDDLADGSGKAHITWIAKELLATAHRMNSALVTNDDGTYKEGTGAIGGFGKSEMRTYLDETIKPLIPENVRNMLKTVKKYSYTFNKSGTGYGTSSDNHDVWLPSAREMGISGAAWSKESTGVQYSGNISANISDIAAFKTKGSHWWLRTGQDKSKFIAVGSSGDSISYNAQGNYRICLCFCT